MIETLQALLAVGDDDALALGAPERSPLSYAGLRSQLAKTRAQLRAAGIGPADVVAIVLPNGPEMASSFLAVGACCTAAPLNPAYRQDEFAYYLEDLQAAALIVLQGDETSARAAAMSLKIDVLEMHVGPKDPAGAFTLDAPSGEAAEAAADPDAVALVLHTSGTTSRPKIVPLSQRNICASAGHIVETLALTPEDRCLNIMPLFHIHGLIGVLLSSMRAGAFVYCSPGFNALRVFGWMEEAKPSWYSAVPTMHQTILARAERNPEAVANAKLRFIRSSSAALPPVVLERLESTFDCPVIESYGMTEAAHQMASNPLPPAARKPGSVGIAAGPEVAVMDETGTILEQGAIGEVVIRGPNVTSGYRNNPDANATAFTDGWFRTGDQGVLDPEGYLTITGRLKELINRGGEKVSPREVDEVLLEHAAIAQAVTFAMPHDKLGEEVAAAVVLREDAEATERELRDFVATKLADYKVPRKVLFLDEIPKGATGKVQRIGLAEKLGLA